MLFVRCGVMGILCSKLPGRGRFVLPGRKVSGIEQDGTSVTVTCADGSAFAADFLIGCDGVHSAVRRLVFKPPTTGWNVKTPPPLESEYRGLFGSCPRPEGTA